MRRTAPAYPYVPRSTARLRVGDIWAVPLSRGRYGCGCVVALCPGRRRLFVAGLTDWVGPAKPTPADLHGRRVIERGVAHIKAITEMGPDVVGYCNVPLEVGVEVREVTWGYAVIRLLAEKHPKAGNLSGG